MIQKGDLGAALRVLIGSILPGLIIGLFTRPDVVAQYLAIMTVTSTILIGWKWSRRARRAAYHQR
jgi:hypothetical protein